MKMEWRTRCFKTTILWKIISFRSATFCLWFAFSHKDFCENVFVINCYHTMKSWLPSVWWNISVLTVAVVKYCFYCYFCKDDQLVVAILLSCIRWGSRSFEVVVNNGKSLTMKLSRLPSSQNKNKNLSIEREKEDSVWNKTQGGNPSKLHLQRQSKKECFYFDLFLFLCCF